MEPTLVISLGATLAALLTVAAGMRSTRKQLESAERTTASQIAASFKLLSEQLESQKQLALSQIASAESTSREEVRSQVLSKSRQEWINDLRNTLAEFITCTHKCRTLRPIAGFKKEVDPTTVRSAVNEAWLNLTRLRLLINPNEDDHRELIGIGKSLFNSITKDDNVNERRETEMRLIEVGQKILKREWERVKELV